MKKSIFLLSILLSYVWSSAQQIQLEVSGDATFSLSGFSIDEAGLDLSSVFVLQNPLYLSISQGDDLTKKNYPKNKWTIRVFKQDKWDEELELSMKRTGSGYRIGNNGNPNIHGGSTFQVIRNNETEFIYGKGEIQSIPVELKLGGYSLTMGAGTFSSKIIFTVYESW